MRIPTRRYSSTSSTGTDLFVIDVSMTSYFDNKHRQFREIAERAKKEEWTYELLDELRRLEDEMLFDCQLVSMMPNPRAVVLTCRTEAPWTIKRLAEILGPCDHWMSRIRIKDFSHMTNVATEARTSAT